MPPNVGLLSYIRGRFVYCPLFTVLYIGGGCRFVFCGFVVWDAGVFCCLMGLCLYPCCRGAQCAPAVLTFVFPFCSVCAEGVMVGAASRVPCRTGFSITLQGRCRINYEVQQCVKKRKACAICGRMSLQKTFITRSICHPTHILP